MTTVEAAICPFCLATFKNPKALGGHMRGPCAQTPEQRRVRRDAYVKAWCKQNVEHLKAYRQAMKPRRYLQHKQWSENNRDKTRAYKKAQEGRLRAFVDNEKAGGCVDCGESDLRCLDFDHKKGKKIANIACMLSDHRPIHVIKAEIDKCVVRCANCHRKRTWSENRNGYQRTA